MTTEARSPSASYAGILSAAALFALGAWAAYSGLLDTIVSYRSDIVYLAGQHLVLVAYSCAIAVAIGLPLGIALTRKPLALHADVITQFINLGTTIPTLAVLALAMSFLGIGAPSAVFGLTVLTLLPIVLNTISGLSMVPRHLVEAATGMGMTDTQILLRVELPNALFVILAGLRTAIAINVGTAPLAFLVGGGGLGELIFTGIDLMDSSMLLAGAIPTAILAITADFVVGQCQFWLIPRGVNPLR
ncbi:ABC transporter permease [Ensifer sp. ENS07]|uniref:ABC transporter permease n=1 Tax=unclassified Ensifer TaxID=2633371 RepID=UPI001781D9A6|nr:MULTISPECIES: ABC transporter permease [unclassified Ensifer]MBD9507989.1 ABC transporter permease [Ensifer sp. ENS10]MBD9637515.1 ABC transporter permease [Ensifer sp. ENS07]